MKITDKYVFFWKEHPFCNFTKCKIKLRWPANGDNYIIFTSSEQMFMWSKAIFFGDDITADMILKSQTPEEARKLGRTVKNYDDSMWNAVRSYYMKKAVLAKFIQNKELRDQLCDRQYNKLQFVEAAYYDRIWGIGFDEEEALNHSEFEWGRNELGKILNEVRDWCLEYRDILG